MQHSLSRRLKTHALVLILLVGIFTIPVGAAASPTAGAPPRPGHHRVAAAMPSRPSTPQATLAFEFPRADLPQQPDVASLAIPGRAGAYLVPYIQSQPDLHFKLRAGGVPPSSTVLVTLDAGTGASRDLEVGGPAYEGTFEGVEKGEHTLSAVLLRIPQLVHMRGTDGGGDLVAWAHLRAVGRGDIISAIGDSTTEGNGGPSFGFLPNWVTAQAKAADWTSADGRNFPQAGALARPQTNASFTSTLGRLLEGVRGHPVLVLNDGWSGATAEAYRHIISSPDLAAEYGVARPTEWLINLGVNDPLTHQSPDQFGASMSVIVGTLRGRFAAQAGAIHVACPSWAAQDSRHQAIAGYLPVVQQLRASAATGGAPNFYNWFRDTPSDLADAVHPNAAGYRDMAGLWIQALGGQSASCT
ncbi:MAG: SGNH/GDSL hydrolase family protein [Candidatus Dormibacteria bacterium]